MLDLERLQTSGERPPIEPPTDEQRREYWEKRQADLVKAAEVAERELGKIGCGAVELQPPLFDYEP